MDHLKQIDPERLEAGRQYLYALEQLGFVPEGLFWGWDEREQEWVLVLASSFFDSAGPLELSKLLFKAFDASVTPKHIDPFMLRLHSPKQSAITDLSKFLRRERIVIHDRAENEIVEKKRIISFCFDGDIQIPMNGIYLFDLKCGTFVDQSRRWKHVSEKIDQMAA